MIIEYDVLLLDYPENNPSINIYVAWQKWSTKFPIALKKQNMFWNHSALMQIQEYIAQLDPIVLPAQWPVILSVSPITFETSRNINNSEFTLLEI